MLKSYLTILLAMIFCSPAFAMRDELPATVEGALSLLDTTLDNSDRYYKAKEDRIDSLKELAAVSPDVDRLRLYTQICKEYQSFNIDSLLRYCSDAWLLAREINDEVTEEQIALLWIESLPIKGITVESVNSLEMVKEDGVFEENKAAYYMAANDVYLMMSLNYSLPTTVDYYMEKRRAYADSVVMTLDRNKPLWKFYKARSLSLHGDSTDVIGLLTEIVDSVPMNDHLFARASSMLGSYFKTVPSKREEAIYYKALAAASDAMCGVREETALHSVAKMLYDQGDVDRAYRYVTHSLENAVMSGSAIRAMQTTEGLPIISATFRDRDQRKLDVLTWLVVALVVALIVIVCSIGVIKRELRNLKEMRKKSNEANLLKDTFISQFLNLCSIYMEKLEEFNRIAGRKIKANQVDDLYMMIKSGKMLDEQKVLFCDIFDDAFTRIYPTFVEDVNKLLLPDKRITLPEGVKLNTELRILAFMRLGLDDTTQIARFMGLSLNTIYTYKNKLKSRSVNRDEFESSVMKIAQLS